MRNKIKQQKDPKRSDRRRLHDLTRYMERRTKWRLA